LSGVGKGAGNRGHAGLQADEACAEEDDDEDDISTMAVDLLFS